MLQYAHMKTLLDKALKQVEALPEERQNNYGEFLLTMMEQDTSDLQLSDVKAREIGHRLTNPESTVSEFEAMEFLKILM